MAVDPTKLQGTQRGPNVTVSEGSLEGRTVTVIPSTGERLYHDIAIPGQIMTGGIAGNVLVLLTFPTIMQAGGFLAGTLLTGGFLVGGAAGLASALAIKKFVFGHTGIFGR